ncbi:hypothetical protein H7I93_18800 [Mycobacterium nebraskense]|uniref:hypothetical protein n=1 Tax=Mycobacterium nebraskense TaxID=244292 RepID=UPI0021F2F10F|nr:hypothetical protein [Mycobacterium nebraskense]MCV7119195.1 hypothetical protein [Mycobacterium nebraskense]
MTVAIKACRNVRPGDIPGTTGGTALTLKSGEEGGVDSTLEAIIVQAGGTDSTTICLPSTGTRQVGG